MQTTRDTASVLRCLGLRGVASAVLRRAAAGARHVAHTFERPASVSDPRFAEALRLSPAVVRPFGPRLRDSTLSAPSTADPRCAWEPARGASLVVLASAGEIAAFERALLEFLPMTHGGDPLEAALRSWNLAVALSMIGPRRLSASATALLACALVEHARWINDHLEDRGLVVGSHLIGEWVGLYACGVVLGAAGDEPAAWRARARAGLARAARVQVLPDGGGIEGSTGYSRFVVELWLAALACARAQGEPPPDGVAAAAARMLGLLAASMTPDGRDPGIGDDDDSIVLPGDPGLAALVPMLASGPLEGRPAGVLWSAQAQWLLGAEGRAIWNAAAEVAWPTSVAAPWFGLWLARRGGLGGDLVTFRAGPHGQQGVGGHAHNDPLSVTVWFDGIPIVVDPGTGMYLGRPAWRDRFRGVAAHATICVDGLEPSPILPTRPFALPDRTRARLFSCEDRAGLWRCVGVHDGYAGIGVTCRREVRYDRTAQRVEIIDTLEASGGNRRHRVDLGFPLAGPARLDGDRIHVERATIETGGADTHREFHWRLDPGAISPRYGEIVPAPVARRSGEVVLPATFVTTITAVGKE